MRPQFVRSGWLRSHGGAPIALAYVLVALVLGLEADAVGARIFAGRLSPISSGSAIAILSAIASGMMALTAIVFSLMFVAVQLANSTYSPRLVRALGEKPYAAHALGIFTGTFLHALLSIRTVDMAGEPGINVSVVVVAMIWLLASVAVLILLLPRVRSITIWDILMALERRASEVTARVYPSGEVSPPRAASSHDVPATGTIEYAGLPRYVVGLDVARLVRCAAEADAVIVIPLAIGDAVVTGDVLAVVQGGTHPVAAHQVRRAIWLDQERSIHNDPGYAIRLYVDIAIRALSPAVNDPTTAVSVLDELDGLLRMLGSRDLEADQVLDESGVVRLVRAVPTWDDLVALALTEIHQYGRESIQVERRLATLVHELVEVLPLERRAAIERFGRWRAQTLPEVIRDPRGWIDASAIDRQGIGHEGDGARFVELG